MSRRDYLYAGIACSVSFGLAVLIGYVADDLSTTSILRAVVGAAMAFPVVLAVYWAINLSSDTRK